MTQTPDFTWLFIKMIAGLILVLALAILLIRVVLPRTRLGRMRRAGWAQVIGHYPLEPHRNLYVVKVLERYLLLGSSEHSVNLVAELSKAEGEKIETT
jgi:flagellar biosynthetic protein FliO